MLPNNARVETGHLYGVHDDQWYIIINGYYITVDEQTFRIINRIVPADDDKLDN